MTTGLLGALILQGVLAQAADPACFPACRDGYLCHQGQCISACNPPCAAGETCTGNGVCQASAPPPAAQPPAAPAVAEPAPTPAIEPPPPAPAPEPQLQRNTYVEDVRTKPATGSVNLHVNVLGLLQLGLIPRLEIGGSTTFLMGAHLFNTGVLSYLVLPDEGDELEFSIGGNIALRHYFNRRGGQVGGYLGGFLEFSQVNTIDRESDMAEYKRGVLVPALEGGYRWVWGSFLMDLGGIAGAAFPVSTEDVPVGTEGCRYSDSCLKESSVFPFAMGVLDIGFFFN